MKLGVNTEKRRKQTVCIINRARSKFATHKGIFKSVRIRSPTHETSLELGESFFGVGWRRSGDTIFF